MVTLHARDQLNPEVLSLFFMCVHFFIVFSQGSSNLLPTAESFYLMNMIDGIITSCCFLDVRVL